MATRSPAWMSRLMPLSAETTVMCLLADAMRPPVADAIARAAEDTPDVILDEKDVTAAFDATGTRIAVSSTRGGDTAMQERIWGTK